MIFVFDSINQYIHIYYIKHGQSKKKKKRSAYREVISNEPKTSDCSKPSVLASCPHLAFSGGALAVSRHALLTFCSNLLFAKRSQSEEISLKETGGEELKYLVSNSG